LISVIIPVYDRFELLMQAAASVLNQEMTDFELIIVDDGSKEEITPAAGLGDERVRVLRLRHTGFPGLVRNRGVEIARGRYLAFLDSDDLWLPEKLMFQTAYFEEHPDVRICHTRERWERNGDTVSQASQRHRREGDLFEESLKKCIIGPSTVMLEKELFLETGGFREEFEIAEDYEYWLRLTAYHRVGYIDTPLTVKRAGGWEQLSEKHGQIEIFRIRGLEDLVDSNFFPPDREAAARKELVRKCRIYAAGCRKRGRTAEAERYEATAVSYEERESPSL
jgi:glycosyltransferase involved in cell wall biosynthesis